MSQTEMDRMRDDLATMKRATGVGLPIGWSDIYLSLAWAVAGVPLAAWAVFSPLDQTTFGLLLVIPCMGVLVLSTFVGCK